MTDTIPTDAPALPDPEEPGDDEPRPVVEVVPTDQASVPEHGAALVVHERPRPLVPGHDIPIIPEYREMQGLAAMAVTLAGADAVPAALRGRPNDVFQVLLTARDLGVAITTGMREFHVIDGKVTLSPKVRLAMVNERGRHEGWAVWPDPGNDEKRATWHATRTDRPGLTFSSTFTMAEADAIPDSNKNGGKLSTKSNWKNYPKRMLSWRALGYLLDDVFPEVGTGLYSPDELGAMTDEDGNAVIDVASTEPLPGTSAPRGHGPKPPDPNQQPLAEADPDGLAAMRARIDVIVELAPEAGAALVELWKQTPDGAEALPAPARVLVGQRRRAEAKIAAIEARVAKGEWASGQGDAPDSAPGEHGRQEATDTAGTPLEAQEGAQDAPGEAFTIAEMVAEMPIRQVLEELDDRKDRLPAALPGSPKAQRALLQVVLEAEAAREAPIGDTPEE